MKHTFLSIDLSLINLDVIIDHNSLGLLSNDGLRVLIDGYNSAGELVTASELKEWVNVSDDAQLIETLIISSAIEYTYEDYINERSDINSIWYIDIAGES